MTSVHAIPKMCDVRELHQRLGRIKIAYMQNQTLIENETRRIQETMAHLVLLLVDSRNKMTNAAVPSTLENGSVPQSTTRTANTTSPKLNGALSCCGDGAEEDALYITGNGTGYVTEHGPRRQMPLPPQ